MRARVKIFLPMHNEYVWYVTHPDIFVLLDYVTFQEACEFLCLRVVWMYALVQVQGHVWDSPTVLAPKSSEAEAASYLVTQAAVCNIPPPGYIYYSYTALWT